MASKCMRASVPKYLHITRLTLELFDPNLPAHYECLLRAINTPTDHSKMGDFGITTPSQFDALNLSTRLSGPYCQGFDPDLDFYYLLRQKGHDKDDDQNGSRPLIGGVSLAQRSSLIPPDIGWCLLEEYMGKGYATEAAREFQRYLREDFGLESVICWPGVGNRESRRVAEKIGMVEAGTLVSRDKEKEGVRDVVYALPGMEVRFVGVVVSQWENGKDG